MIDRSPKFYAPEALIAWEQVRSRINKSALARHLNITSPAITAWRAVPDVYIEQVAEFTMIPVESLRPDLKGDAAHVTS